MQLRNLQQQGYEFDVNDQFRNRSVRRVIMRIPRTTASWLSTNGFDQAFSRKEQPGCPDD